MPTATLAIPVGLFGVEETAGAISRAFWARAERHDRSELLDAALTQLRAYFAGERRGFDLPLAPAGSGFAAAVREAMLAIPYGETRSYGEIAKALGTWGQPVGAACGGNPIPVIVPCHRVLAADGLGGFSAPGGVATKIALLKLEGGYPFLV